MIIYPKDFQNLYRYYTGFPTRGFVLNYLNSRQLDIPHLETTQLEEMLTFYRRGGRMGGIMGHPMFSNWDM